MTETIETFVAKLKTEGVEAGQKQADQLRADAEKQAEQIVRDAKSEAQKIVAEAKTEADNLLSRGHTELELAARDAAMKLREALVGVLQTILVGPVSEQLRDGEFLKTFIEEIVMRYVEADIKSDNVTVNVSSELAGALGDLAGAKLRQLVASDAGKAQLQQTLRQAGFEFNFSGATVEVTQDSVVETLMELVGPRLREIFSQAMAGKS